MIIDAQYDVHLIIELDEIIYICMGNWAGDSIVYNDVMKDYDQNSMVTMDVIKDSYDRAGFYWWNRNIISSKDGSNRTWYLASPLQFTDKQVEIAILEFEDTRNNRNLPS